MAFWDIFTAKKEEKKSNHSQLHHKIEKLLPNSSEEKLIEVTCLAGLLARVAYIDFEIHQKELETMKDVLAETTFLDATMADAIVTLSLEEIKELAGLENHKYCHPLNDILDNSQKYEILESLFTLAASDGSVHHTEAEEIRVISTGLKLEHKHFIAARATVLDRLAALNSK